MKLIKNNQLIVPVVTISFILFVAYFCTQVFLHEQYAVDGGLILSKKIIYPDNFSPLIDDYLGAWTSIYQISALLFKFNWSVLDVSKFFIFFVALFYLLGIMSIIHSFTKSILIVLFVSLLLIIFQKNFGDADYPTLFFTPHTFGALSLAITTCIFGLVFLGYFFWVGFLSIALICVHPVVGLWINFIIFSSVAFFKLILKEEFNTKGLFYGATIGIVITIISFFAYLNQSFLLSGDTDLEAISNYYKYWEGHRKNADFHYEYLVKTFALFILCIFSLAKLKQYLSISVRLGIWSVLISIVLSSLIYISYKIINFPLWLTAIMPTRFVIMHSVVGWPIILGALFVIINQNSKEKRKFLYLAPLTIILIVSIYTIQHYKTLLSLKKFYIENAEYENILSEKNNFWEIVKNTKIEGYVLTNSSSSKDTLRKGLKPVLLNPGIIDGVPYFPKTAGRLAKIIEEIYGIPYANPPLELRNNASISNDIIKLNFENYSKEKWQQISRKFKISAIIIPVNWNIDLVPVAKNNNFAFYII